jgi:hypothetical protein
MCPIGPLLQLFFLCPCISHPLPRFVTSALNLEAVCLSKTLASTYECTLLLTPKHQNIISPNTKTTNTSFRQTPKQQTHHFAKHQNNKNSISPNTKTTNTSFRQTPKQQTHHKTSFRQIPKQQKLFRVKGSKLLASFFVTLLEIRHIFK